MAYVKITNFAIKDSTNDVIRGTEHDDEYNAIEASFVAQPSATQTLTNKTLALGSNTVSGTTAQFNTALSDGDFATLAGSETLTNKALNGSLGATTPSTVVATDLTTTGNTILGNASTDTLNVGNGDLIKDASGNVGIGVTPSAWGSNSKVLQVGSNGYMSFENYNGLASIIYSNSYRNSSNQNIYLTTAPISQYAQSGGIHYWFNAPSGTAGNVATLTQAMTLDASGNLLVGTTATTSGARFSLVSSNNTTATYNSLFKNSSGTILFAMDDGGSFYTGSAASSPWNATTASGANVVIVSTGQLQRSTSSLKYKTDVENSSHGLAEVLKLRSVTYKGKNDGDTIFGGLIAEEVDEAGLTEFVTYAEDGSPDALAYGQMVSLAFKAIQEQQAMIDELKAKVAALEAA